MKDKQRFAPIGLIVTGVGILAAVVIYFLQREFSNYVQISLLLAILGLSIFILLDPDRVRRALSGRQAKYGSNILILGIAFVGTLVIINFLAYRYPYRKDLTEDKEYTLSPETINALNALKNEVNAQAFYTPRVNSEQASELLEQYKINSRGKFNYEFIDPEANPVAAQNAKITRDGTVVLVMNDRQEAITFVSEQELSGALVRLMSPQDYKIYFLTGHGEYNPDETGERGYSQVKQTLESKNYTVESLNLLTGGNIPGDAKVLVVAGPNKPLSQEEVNLISEYLESGGSLVYMQEPTPLTEFGEAKDPAGEFIKDEWGIHFGDNMIIDLNSIQPFAPFAGEYAPHPITTSIERMDSQFPTVRSVTAEEAVDGTSVVELVKTGPNSWVETDLKDIEKNPQDVAYEINKDTPGPVPIAVVGEKFENDSRLVVFGDSDFPNNANYFAYANGDLIINSIDWAARKENIINLTPKETTQRVMLAPERFTMNLLFLGTVIVLPGLALVGGLLVFLQRRRRI